MTARMWSAFAVLFLAVFVSPALSAPSQSKLQAPGPDGPLAGTMLRAASGSRPIMLMIPGSGPTDRDGNSPLGVKAAPYRLLAEGLSARGVSTVRIDKRGMFGSRTAVADANAVTIDDYAKDVGKWIAVIRKQTGAPCVWVLGHSEGGLVALAAAKRATGICGLVLVAAAGRPLGEVIRQQLRSSPVSPAILDQAMSAIDRLETGHRVDVAGMDRGLLPLFAPAVQGFLIDAFSYDPAKLIASVDKPVLIVQGTRDIQIGVEDAERLKRAAPDAKLALIPDMNHVLKTVTSDERPANVATYADPALPLAAGVVDAIANFVAAPAEK